ncbi:DUF4089 domain-containing protein [Acidithiobacillus sp. M4-SHS-6]|uniref:DUF4089 domain-containing protein n=1 Tax=Acidithiobacillus sp. M4-SHS-6 TaxID=3383024 RepID=UPI0039BEB544
MNTLRPLSEAVVEQYMQVTFETMDLTVEAAWYPDIRNYFYISARLAEILEACPLDITEDLATVFQP